MLSTAYAVVIRLCVYVCWVENLEKCRHRNLLEGFKSLGYVFHFPPMVGI